MAFAIRPDPQKYRELSAAKVLDSRLSWAPMSLAQGKLIVRGHRQMRCLDLKAR